MTPQQRAIKVLESEGYAVDVVERISRFGNRTWRNDLWGGFDLLGIDSEGGVKAVQVTSRANVASRVKKIEDLPVLGRLRKAEWGLFVYGWGPTKTKGDWLIVDLS